MRGSTLASAIALVLFAGCSSLLGDFGQGGPLPSEGGIDAKVHKDAPGGTEAHRSDAGNDARPDAPHDAPTDGPPRLLACKSWKNATPTLLDKIAAFDSGSNNSPIHRIYVEHIGALSAARVVASENLPSGSDTTIYTVDEGGGSSFRSVTFASTNVAAEAKTTGATTVLLQEYMTDQYVYYSLADTDMGMDDAAALTPVATNGSPPSVGDGNFGAAFVEMMPSQFYTLASYAATTPGQFEVAWWLPPTTSAWGVLTTTGELQLNSSLVPAGTGGDVYGFYVPLAGGSSMGPGPISQFTFNMGTAPKTRSVTAAGETGSTISTAVSGTGDFELAFVTIATSGSITAAVRAGLVSSTKVDSFMIDDLPSLSFKPGGDAGFFDTTPFGGDDGPGGRWLSNGAFAIMGAGGTGGTGYTGLNFYVGNTNAQWIIETAGTGQNVLAGQTIGVSAFDLQQVVGDILYTFDVAWAEQALDGSTSLYFNQLTCE
jgi:hypothetical protein